MLEVERASWKGIARRGMGDRYSTLFYSGMVRRLAVSGSARVIFARAGERDIGFIFGGLAGTVYRGQQFSYADDWAPFSIGNLMQQEQIAWLAEDAILKYDMGPLMDYKDHWTETRIDMEVLLLRPRRGPGSAGSRRSPTRRATEDQGE
jgi:CelD/BcsL family acetyltransferase involved in cellulose biosynthesis